MLRKPFPLVVGILSLAASTALADEPGRGAWPAAPGPLIAPAGRFARTWIVSPVGTPQMNGAALLAALAAIPTPGQGNPWLLKVEPGVYDLGSANLLMREYVDVEGSGEQTTFIRAAGESSDSIGTVNGADHTELRQVTVESVGGSFAKAVVAGAGTRITHVTARASGGGTANYGIFVSSSQAVVSNSTTDVNSTGNAVSWGVLVIGNVTPRIQNVVSLAFGGAEAHGLACFSGAAPFLVDVEAQGLAATTLNRGLTNLDSSPRLRNVTAIASGASSFADGIANFGTSAPAFEHVTARAFSTTGQATGLYNGPGTTPSINDLLVTAQGATDAWGMNNDGILSPPMDHVTASAFNSGGSTNSVAAIRNSNSAPVITHLTALAVGGVEASGILNMVGSTPLLSHVTSRAQGGGTNAGIRNVSGSNVQVIDALAVGTGGLNSAGVHTESASVSLTNVTANASGSSAANVGIQNLNAGPVALRDVVSVGSNGPNANGLRNSGTGTTVQVDRSTLQGTVNAVANLNPSTINVGASRMMGTVVNSGGGTVTCTGSYNVSFTPLNAACQ